jgi:hypothetical protein
MFFIVKPIFSKFSSQKNEHFIIKIFNNLISNKISYCPKSHKYKISNEKRISMSKFKKLIEKH